MVKTRHATSMVLAAALLVGAAFLLAGFAPAALAAEYTNGIEHVPPLTVALLFIQPLPLDSFLVVSRVESGDEHYLYMVLIRADGTEEGALIPW